MAKKDVIAGWVKVDGETVREAARKITDDKSITVKRPGGRFVSRGGEKLSRALNFFEIKLGGMTVLDLGASTGGFTDCMLQAGAVKVYAVDVGYNQLDYSLRIDDRVVVMEKTHARDIKSEMFDGTIDFFSADLSFISILKVLPAVRDIFDSICGVILIKPQFEAGADEQQKGVVRDMADHRNILARVIGEIRQIGFYVKGLTYSPIKGPAGNIEFLAFIEKGDALSSSGLPEIERVVREAHDVLN